MGCDIHVFIERRLNGKWVPVNAPPQEGELDYGRAWPWGAWTDPPNPMEELAQVTLPFEERVPSKAQEWAFGRNYASFGRLSGVRGGTPYREPNGYPADLSDGVRAELWGGDDHTPTHWTLADLDEAHKNRDVREEEWGAERISELLWEMKRIAEEYNITPADVRMVCFYDN
jgi:hypothetical protein